MEEKGSSKFFGERQKKRKYKIAFVSDFFYPKLGGVEMHQYQLAECLQKLGHKIIIITNTKGKRQGIRYLGEGLKVYHTPIKAYFDGASVNLLWMRFPLYRNIFIREGIEIGNFLFLINKVHGHQTSSQMNFEAMLVAGVMGLKCMFTDHSLFNFIAFENHILNKMIKTLFCHLDATI